MDQTLLPCVMDDKRTYESTGVDEVWIPSGQSGLERRQCTAQLTMFVDESALLPLLIFHDKWLQINPTEKNNDIAKVIFQPKAWCDEAIMKRWVEEDWNNIIFHNPLTPQFSDIFYADVRRVQQTPDVKHWLHKCKITMNLNIRV